MTYYNNQTPLIDFHDDDDSPLSEVNPLRDLRGIGGA